MKLTYKAIALMCGFKVLRDGDNWHWYTQSSWPDYTRKYPLGRGRVQGLLH